ncbi:hypothetical protein VCRA2130O400_1840001 [Vibrio crassostreae]|nr:hypothetical protein VCRA2130O400_1840001 [Vibrio crassostreae]
MVKEILCVLTINVFEGVFFVRFFLVIVDFRELGEWTSANG